MITVNGGRKKTPPIHSHPAVASTFLKLQEMFSCGRRSTAWSNLLGIWAVGVPKIGWFFGGAPKNHDNSWFGMTINNDNNNNNNSSFSMTLTTTWCMLPAASIRTSTVMKGDWAAWWYNFHRMMISSVEKSKILRFGWMTFRSTEPTFSTRTSKKTRTPYLSHLFPTIKVAV